MIAQFLDAAEIAEVVWIDDYFAEMPLEEAADRIRRHLGVAKERQLAVVGVPHLGAFDLNRSTGEIIETVETLFEDLGREDVLRMEEALAHLVGASPETGGQPDMLPEEFASLRTAFGTRLKTFSAGQWTAVGAVQYAGSNQTVLFLIDKQFHREGSGIDGLKFLRDLVERANSYCIVLTHASTPQTQNDDRGGIAKTIGIQPHQFCVVGKAQDRSLSVDQRFGRAIFEVFARYLTGQLAHLLADAISKATLEAVEEIGRESVYDADHAIFENSIEEGASEADVILRIFRSRQKPMTFSAVQADAVQLAVRKIRDFRAKTEGLRDQLGPTKVDLKKFREWRHDEVFENAAALNLLHSPLVCGDLFEVTLASGRTKRYILLAQACGLAVRGKNGKRTSEVGQLVPIVEMEPRKKTTPPTPAPAGAVAPPVVAPPNAPEGGEEEEGEDDSPYKYFDVKGVLEAEKTWRVDFRSTMYVSLKVLDLTVFNPDGQAQLRRDHSEPKVTLLPGWKKRFDTARRGYAPVRAGLDPSRWSKAPKLPSALGNGAESVEPDRHDGRIISYPLRRSGRVETNLADAIYAAWAVYQTRAAFDHDFAKLDYEELQEAEAGPTQEPPPRSPPESDGTVNGAS